MEQLTFTIFTVKNNKLDKQVSIGIRKKDKGIFKGKWKKVLFDRYKHEAIMALTRKGKSRRKVRYTTLSFVAIWELKDIYKVEEFNYEVFKKILRNL